MDFLGVTHSVMHETTRAILDGLVKDVTDKTQLNDSQKMTSELAELNKSYAVASFPFTGEDRRQEVISDFDSIAVATACKIFRNDPTSSPLLFLEDLIVDVSNMVAYRRYTSNACPEFKVVKTENNDR